MCSDQCVCVVYAAKEMNKGKTGTKVCCGGKSERDWCLGRWVYLSSRCTGQVHLVGNQAPICPATESTTSIQEITGQQGHRAVTVIKFIRWGKYIYVKCAVLLIYTHWALYRITIFSINSKMEVLKHREVKLWIPFHVIN